MDIDNIKFEFVHDLPSEVVVELYKEAHWWKETAHAREIIPKMIAGSFCFLVAYHNAQVIGMGRAISDGVSDAYIQDIVVKKDFRGNSIGKEIIHRLVHFCQSHGLLWIGLIAEPDTESFYENLGFQKMEKSTPMLFKGFTNGK